MAPPLNFLFYIYLASSLMKTFKKIPSFALPIVSIETSGLAFVFGGYFYL